ncbi:MAG TPA: lipoprotein insertase outer membrane protein LolB [Casimicrobiaceae bacterium]
MAALRSIAPLSKFAGAFAVGGLLVACAPAPLERGEAQAALPPAQEAFEASGRLSAKHGAEGLAANFQWRHEGAQDDLELSSPLGQTIAVLTGDGGSVRLRSADGRVLTATNWTALTERGLGWPLPVDGLKYWMQGAARVGAPFTSEAGADGRAAVLRQDGWTIVYQGYRETPAAGWRPSQMTLTYPEVELRLAIDRWQ